MGILDQFIEIPRILSIWRKDSLQFREWVEKSVFGLVGRSNDDDNGGSKMRKRRRVRRWGGNSDISYSQDRSPVIGKLES